MTAQPCEAQEVFEEGEIEEGEIEGMSVTFMPDHQEGRNDDHNMFHSDLQFATMAFSFQARSREARHNIL